MKTLRPEILESIKKQYPTGTIVELIDMDDPYAPPEGTRGIVHDVDDIGSLLVTWENGSSLHVLYGVDHVKKIR